MGRKLHRVHTEVFVFIVRGHRACSPCLSIEKYVQTEIWSKCGQEQTGLIKDDAIVDLSLPQDVPVCNASLVAKNGFQSARKSLQGDRAAIQLDAFNF